MFSIFKKKPPEAEDEPVPQPERVEDPAVTERLHTLATEIVQIDEQLHNDRTAMLARRREELLAEQQAIQQSIFDERRETYQRRQHFATLGKRVAELVKHNDRIGGWFHDWIESLAAELERLDKFTLEYYELQLLLTEMRQLAEFDPSLADGLPSLDLRSDFSDIADFMTKMAGSISEAYRRRMPGPPELRLLKNALREQAVFGIQPLFSSEQLARVREHG